MKVLDNVSILNKRMSCKRKTINYLLECCVLCFEKKGTREDVWEFLTRDFYTEVDMYYAMKINAYWGDVCIHMSPAENSFLIYMLNAAKEENVGVMSVLYNFFTEHCMYSEEGEPYANLQELFDDWSLD